MHKNQLRKTYMFDKKYQYTNKGIHRLVSHLQSDTGPHSDSLGCKSLHHLLKKYYDQPTFFKVFWIRIGCLTSSTARARVSTWTIACERASIQIRCASTIIQTRTWRTRINRTYALSQQQKEISIFHFRQKLRHFFFCLFLLDPQFRPVYCPMQVHVYVPNMAFKLQIPLFWHGYELQGLL